MKKQLEKGLFKKVLASLFLTIVISYFLAAALRMVTEMNKLQENLSDFYGTINFIENADAQLQLVLVALTVIIFFFVLSKLGLYKRGYQDASDHGVHGTSRWGKFDELLDGGAVSDQNKFYPKKIEKTLKIENGIVIGKNPEDNRLLIIPPDTSIDNTNVLVIGSSGSGKGQAFVFNNMVNIMNQTMIVTDPKGEIYHATHQLKRDQGYEVFQIDFLNLNQAKYNPLDYVFKDLDAKKIAEAVAKNSAKDGKEDFFFTTARDLLTGLIIYCKSENNKASIPVDVKREFYKISEDEEYLFKLCEKMGEEHPAYAYLKDASVAEGKTRTSILSSFAQQTAIFSLKDVAAMTTESDFNFHDFQRKKSILYVKIPMKANPVEALTATFFDQLISVFYDIADKHNSVLPLKTIFIADEFANLGVINDYQGTLSTCRGLGLSFCTIIQDFGQIEDKYGEKVARTIINNHDTTLFLRTKDAETAKYFSSLAGETTARMMTSSNSQQGGGIFSTNSSSSKSQSEQLVKRPLLTEGELTNINSDTCYVFIAGYYPIKLEKAYQFNVFGDFLFKNRKPAYDESRERYLSFLEKNPIKEEEINFIEEDKDLVDKPINDADVGRSIEGESKESVDSDKSVELEQPKEISNDKEEVTATIDENSIAIDPFEQFASEFFESQYSEERRNLEDIKKSGGEEGEKTINQETNTVHVGFETVDNPLEEITNIVDNPAFARVETQMQETYQNIIEINNMKEIIGDTTGSDMEEILEQFGKNAYTDEDELMLIED